MTREGRNSQGHKQIVATFAQDLDVLRRHETTNDIKVCLLGVSVSTKPEAELHNEPFYGKSWKAILEAVALNKFTECIIVIGCTLQRHNLERQGLSKTQAYRQSKKLGEDWKTVKRKLAEDELPVSNGDLIKQILEDQGIKVTIRHWDEYIQSAPLPSEVTSFAASSSAAPSIVSSPYSRFNEMLTSVEKTDDPINNPLFHEQLNRVVKAVLNPASNTKLTITSSERLLDFASEQAQCVRSYIKEELAVMAIWGIQHHGAMFPYPTKKGAKVMRLVQECYRIFVASLEISARREIKLYLLGISLSEPGSLKRSSPRTKQLLFTESTNDNIATVKQSSNDDARPFFLSSPPEDIMSGQRKLVDDCGKDYDENSSSCDSLTPSDSSDSSPESSPPSSSSSFPVQTLFNNSKSAPQPIVSSLRSSTSLEDVPSTADSDCERLSKSDSSSGSKGLVSTIVKLAEGGSHDEAEELLGALVMIRRAKQLAAQQRVVKQEKGRQVLEKEIISSPPRIKSK